MSKSRRVLIVAALGALAWTAAADVVTLTPLDAQAETSNGTNWVISDGGAAITTTRAASGAEKRGILEFPLSSIPAGADVQSAVLTITIAGFTSPPDPVIEFHGYAGNGALNVADATVPFNLVGTSPAIASLADYNVTLDPDYIEGLLGSASHLGLLAFQQQLDKQASFYSDEGPLAPATLYVTYVPEPGALSVLALVSALLRRER